MGLREERIHAWEQQLLYTIALYRVDPRKQYLRLALGSPFFDVSPLLVLLCSARILLFISMAGSIFPTTKASFPTRRGRGVRPRYPQASNHTTTSTTTIIIHLGPAARPSLRTSNQTRRASAASISRAQSGATARLGQGSAASLVCTAERRTWGLPRRMQHQGCTPSRSSMEKLLLLTLPIASTG